MLGSGCSNSSVNETASTAPQGATGASAYKDGGAPPQTYKDFYLREQQVGKSQSTKKGAPAKGVEAVKGGDAAKGAEAAKP